MVLTLTRVLAVLCIALLAAFSTPADAHEEHDAAEQTSGQAGASEQPLMEHPAIVEDEPPRSWSGRPIDWLGRLHPFAVHFPIALFPIGWLALFIARRRGDGVDVIRSIIIIAGIASVAAAVLGWLNGGFVLADRDPVLLAHRWTGAALGVIGAIVALWAWRRPASVNSRAMVWILGLATLVLLAQGWLGGALVHGIDHMNM